MMWHSITRFTSTYFYVNFGRLHKIAGWEHQDANKKTLEMDKVFFSL